MLAASSRKISKIMSSEHLFLMTLAVGFINLLLQLVLEMKIVIYKLRYQVAVDE